MQVRWALFISGQGSNMSVILDEPQEKASVALVVSSNPESYGLLRAQRMGVPTLVLDKKINWESLLNVLRERGITHIFLLGFMKIVSPLFLEQWQKPILNVHPSLLPLYPGLNSIRRAFEEKNDVGVTVHRVIAEVDAGSILFQKKVVSAGEELPFEEVEKRVHLAEYELVLKSFKVASCWT